MLKCFPGFPGSCGNHVKVFSHYRHHLLKQTNNFNIVTLIKLNRFLSKYFLFFKWCSYNADFGELLAAPCHVSCYGIQGGIIILLVILFRISEL